MADPRLKYQNRINDLYGLGLGGISSEIAFQNYKKKQRSPFAEEGPGVSLSASPPQNSFTPIEKENPLGLAPFVVGALNDAIQTSPEVLETDYPMDAVDFEDFASVYGDIMSAIDSNKAPVENKPLTTSQIQEKIIENPLLVQAEGPESVLNLNEIDEKLALLNEKKELKEKTENFRKKESQIVEQQGGLNSSPVDPVAPITQDQANESFMAAMDDFIQGARGAGPEAPKKRTIAEYKRVFSEATGIDTSGNVDKSDALMAFGLALMQNKAGKNFNVSKMLNSVGAAGEKAMPALQRAKALARDGAIAAGKYALQTQSADKATRAAAAEKMMNRESYYIYEEGPVGKPYEKFDNGKTVQLNKYELNELIKNPEFDKKYSFISNSQYLDVLKEKNAIPEYGDQWDPNSPISLIGDPDGPKIFEVSGARRSSNYKGPRTGNSLQLASSPDEVYRRMMKEQDKVNLLADQFAEAITEIQKGISIPSQIGSAVTMGLRNLGFNVGGGTTSIKQVKNFLLRIQSTNAANILGESGKTLSDNDRKMVANIVGDVNFNTATEEELLSKLSYVYEMVVDRSQANIDTALNTLENEAGVVLPRSNELSPEQLEYLNEKRVASGKKPYTMEEVKKFKY